MVGHWLVIATIKGLDNGAFEDVKKSRNMLTQINSRLRNMIGLICIIAMMTGSAQSLKHPVIYITQQEREQVLKKIKEYDWAKSIVGQLHQNVDPKLKRHRTHPAAIIDSVPPFSNGTQNRSEQDAAPLASEHYNMLKLASEAGMLYYLSQREEYAQLAADIIQVYIEELAPRSPETTTITGNAFFDPRTTYPHLALAYDFIHAYITKQGVRVYSSKQGNQIPFDNEKAQKALHNMVGNVLQEYGKPDVHGQVVSNHPILTSPGALFSILCIEDDLERERMFNIFWKKGTAHQNSFKNTILPIFSEQGLWPESLSYGFMPIVSMNLNIIDRVKPELNVTSKTKHIFNGSFLYDYLRYPDRRFVRYGDSKRNNDYSANNYRYALHVAQRRGYTDIEKKAKKALRQAYYAQGGYSPNMTGNGPYDQYPHLQLFWGIDIPEHLDKNIDFNMKSVIIDHAGIALQRNYVEKNNELYGLCGIIGGAHYVHSHLTGISMELYGAGYVMSPNAGLPPTVAERQIPLHEHYFRLYAGSNTVVVNGTSHGLDKGSWKGKANVWQNTVVNRAAEPKHLEEGIAEEFSFATQFLDDTVNKVTQERTLSTIRTGEKTGYYFDIFRSKANTVNKFHDYIYHNLGDSTRISNLDNEELPLKRTDRYQNDIGDVVKSPGWRYFENTKSTEVTESGIKIRFDIEFDGRYMHLFVPEGVPREYTKALAPPTREAKNGYVDKKTQVLVIRQKGEAWNRPFIGVFEPSTQKKASVQKVEPLLDGENIVGAMVTSKVGDSLITDFIISQDNNNAIYKNKTLNLYFKGRFGIVRKTIYKNETNIILYIGEGDLLKFGTKELKSNQEQQGLLRLQ